MMFVVGLGYCCVDFIGLVPRIPSIDESVRMLESTKQGGGVVATAIVTLARLGVKTCFLGCVGDDDNGRFVISDLKNEGVNISKMIIVPNLRTSFSYILIDKSTGKRTIAYYYDSLLLKYLAKIDMELIKEANVLHIDGAHEASIRAAKIAKKAGVTVSCDTAGYAPDYHKILKFIDVFIPSIDMAQLLTGKMDPIEAAKKLLRAGPSIVGVTLGDQGSICVTKDRVIRKPAFKVNVMDTTGAGDIYHGAFIFGLLQEWPLDIVVEFSNAVSAIKCEKLGGRAGIPTLSQVESFLRNHGIKLPPVKTLRF